MGFKYKVAVLGPVPRDHIITYQGEIVDKYGGINNPAIALARLLGPESVVVPVVHLRKNDEAKIKKILADYPNIDLQFINSTEDQGDVIQLHFVDQNRRIEKQSAFMNPIVPDDVKNLLDCDSFVFVPVTDFEVSLETLKFIKNYSEGTIIFDAHGPTNLVTALGDRLLKFWADRDSWLPYIDVLKMNLDEAKCCWFRNKYKLQELENDYEFTIKDLPPFAKYCLQKGVKAVYVTLDKFGCVVYYQDEGKMQEKLVSAVELGKVVDTAGCGDSFAAGLAFGLLISADYEVAGQYANVVGALRTQGTDFSVFKDFAYVEKIIKDNYGV